jgi:Zn-dependent protease/predicted transcriptional regulator
MDDNSLPLGTIRGIKLRLHWSWSIIFVLLTWSLAVSVFPQSFKASNQAEYWLLGAAGALLLFVTVLIHELSHSFVARAQGLPVDSITLYLLGGVSSLNREPESASAEFWMAFAGPLASLVLGALFLGLHLLLYGPTWLGALFAYLGEINILLALFNLVPAFPLDGGRVLRSIAWGITQSRSRATALATSVGQWIAWGFIFFGIWLVVLGMFITGLWLVFIGWFVQNSALAYRAMEGTGGLKSLRVADAMTTHPVTVSPDLRLDSAVKDYLLHQDERALPVVSEGRLLGLLSVTDIQHMPLQQWSLISVWRAMTPVERLDTITSDSSLMDALRLMSEHRRHELAVVQDTQLVGLLSRSKALHYLQVRRDLGLDSNVPPSNPTGHETAA